GKAAPGSSPEGSAAAVAAANQSGPCVDSSDARRPAASIMLGGLAAAGARMITDYEKLGAFYLGKVFDPAAGGSTEAPLLYDSRDLTTHAVCVGMTGSGKTGLCLALLEEAAIDGIPAICI